MTPSAIVDSYRRVQALGEVSDRYKAIITGLLGTIEDVIDDVDGDVLERLRGGLDDAGAQITATSDALDRALKDLPEGGQP